MGLTGRRTKQQLNHLLFAQTAAASRRALTRKQCRTVAMSLVSARLSRDRLTLCNKSVLMLALASALALLIQDRYRCSGGNEQRLRVA